MIKKNIKSPVQIKALRDLIEVYPHRYEATGLFNKQATSQVKEYILFRDFKNLINIPLDQDRVARFSKETQQVLNYPSALDDICQDIVVIGYLYRLLDKTNIAPREYKKFATVEDMLKTLFNNIEKRMNALYCANPVADTGFSTPLLFDENVLHETLEDNLRSLRGPGKLLDFGAIILLVTIGWCLARYDISKQLAG